MDKKLIYWKERCALAEVLIEILEKKLNTINKEYAKYNQEFGQWRICKEMGEPKEFCNPMYESSIRLCDL